MDQTVTKVRKARRGFVSTWSSKSANQNPGSVLLHLDTPGCRERAHQVPHAALFCHRLSLAPLTSINTTSTSTFHQPTRYFPYIYTQTSQLVLICRFFFKKRIFNVAVRASSCALTGSMGCGGGRGCEVAPSSRPWSNIAWVRDIARTSIGARLGCIIVSEDPAGTSIWLLSTGGDFHLKLSHSGCVSKRRGRYTPVQNVMTLRIWAW